ncbi:MULTISPECIES: acetyl-CoA carboxylase biotin carboxyl carrier protein [Corynebacterium]|uniref:acetyl-CoA carboxylase biotin carboxyl carrier protein n=1 Tax=Corynebacterium TaxID=1716 RepID=UPI0018840840|nr:MULTISPECIES: acetyl-CoA carboxylase biotin carboxyl carrier protein [Corynebacterium]MBF0581354.1 acetyl-CoA carboxylase biotin carboxyl carrier protein [Corynebacterium sp. ED61]
MSEQSTNLSELKALLEWVNLSDDIQELSIRYGTTELNMSRTPGGLNRAAAPSATSAVQEIASAPAPASSPAPTQPETAPAEDSQPKDVSAPAPAASESAHGTAVKSPMVGTFYASPQPGAPAFVKVGDEVEVGQKLCIIEVMKLMNNIEAKVAGTVTEILVNDEDAVEHGQPLMIINPK